MKPSRLTEVVTPSCLVLGADSVRALAKALDIATA